MPRTRTAAQLVVLLGLVFGPTGCSAPPLVDEQTVAGTGHTALAPFTLGPGDLVAIQVFGEEQLSTPEDGARIAVDGTLNFPLVGSVAVTGLTPEAAQTSIEEKLARYLKKPRVTLTVLEYESRQFFLLGEVVKAGSFPLNRPLTALQAVSLGEGFSEKADRESVALLRLEGEQLTPHFFNADTPDGSGFVPVHDGDVIFVRRTGSGVFRDTALPYVQGIASPLGALASLIVVVDALSTK